jgi:UV DNA damage repair endonuclease
MTIYEELLLRKKVTLLEMMVLQIATSYLIFIDRSRGVSQIRDDDFDKTVDQISDSLTKLMELNNDQ